jgi:hypothetical protein
MDAGRTRVIAPRTAPRPARAKDRGVRRVELTPEMRATAGTTCGRALDPVREAAPRLHAHAQDLSVKFGEGFRRRVVSVSSLVLP